MIFFKKIVFDCDSTLVKIEGLDELARVKGKKEEVAELTKLSMDGKVKLEEVFTLKMAMIRPSREDVLNLGRLYTEAVVEDIVPLISLLHGLKKDVLQVTGNFYPAVKILASFLGIPKKHIYANQVYFNQRGEYVGFDFQGPLSISGGKRIVMREIYQKDPQTKAVFIGDGSTDMDTKPPVDLFIGYGGVVARQNIEKCSDIYVISESLTPVLRFILTEEEQRQGKKMNKSLFEKADQLIKKGFVSVKNAKLRSLVNRSLSVSKFNF